MTESNRAIAEGLADELLVRHRQAQRDGEKGQLTDSELLKLAEVYSRLASLDAYDPMQLAELDRCETCGSTDPEHLAAHGGRSVVDVPLPGQAEGDSPADLYPAGACSECGTPELLGHKLNCSQAVR